MEISGFLQPFTIIYKELTLQQCLQYKNHEKDIFPETKGYNGFFDNGINGINEFNALLIIWIILNAFLAKVNQINFMKKKQMVLELEANVIGTNMAKNLQSSF